jgi:hypothetical protein
MTPVREMLRLGIQPGVMSGIWRSDERQGSAEAVVHLLIVTLVTIKAV